MRTKLCVFAAAVSSVFAILLTAAPAADDAPAKADPHLYQQTVQRGIAYLTSKGQAADGSYSAKISPAVTALCTSACCATACRPTIRPWPRA